MSDVFAFIAGFYVLFFIVTLGYAFYKVSAHNRAGKKPHYVVVPTQASIGLSVSIAWLVAYFFVIGK